MQALKTFAQFKCLDINGLRARRKTPICNAQGIKWHLWCIGDRNIQKWVCLCLWKRLSHGIRDGALLVAHQENSSAIWWLPKNNIR